MTLPLSVMAESFFTETFVRISTACTISVSLTLCPPEEREATDDALPKVTDTATISNILADRIRLTVPCKLTRTYFFKYSFSYAFNYAFSCFRWFPLISTQTILTFACIPFCLVTVMASTINILAALKLTQVALASTVNPFTLLHFLAVSSFMTLPLSVMAESFFTETFVRVSTAGTISVSLTLYTPEEREATDDAFPKVTDTASISNILADRINLTVPCKLTRSNGHSFINYWWKSYIGLFAYAWFVVLLPTSSSFKPLSRVFLLVQAGTLVTLA